MQRIITDDYKTVCVNKLDNLQEMNKFPNTYNLPRKNPREIKNLNRLIMSGKEAESEIKCLPPKKSPEPDGISD